jgi:hypothetical protein
MAEFVAEVFCHNIFSGLPSISRSLKGEWSFEMEVTVVCDIYCECSVALCVAKKGGVRMRGDWGGVGVLCLFWHVMLVRQCG